MKPRFQLPAGLWINWPLWLGALLVIAVIVIAVYGPALAPQDPLQENRVLQVKGVWLAAPFAPLAAPGFPLGSDERGRDLLSLLLWAVRPTLFLVAIVASVRLVVAIVIGLVSGWSAGVIGRGLEALISAALAAPVLIVALAVVAAVGVERGVLAFVLGLSLTGWAEAARVVREQTRSIHGQTYIEASRALGASSPRILLQHVLPQITPLIWVLFAFEISNTLLTVAGLGFLGYYTSEQWVMITDTAAQRFSHQPELGQMLATVTTDIFTGPWKMFAAGSMVFVTVLGFNLLGEGLRTRWLNPARRRTPLNVLMLALGDWLEARLWPWARSPRGRRVLIGLGAVAVVMMLALAGGWWWQTQQAALAGPTRAALTIPGNHLWATERHDPYGTRYVEAPSLSSPPDVAWTFSAQGFSGGPAISADGRIYIASLAPSLYALNAAGEVQWEAPLSEPPVGAPALDAQGNIFIAEKSGGLMAFTPDGQVKWRFQLAKPSESTGSPIVGADGTIYYTLAGDVQAVTPDGTSKWRTTAFPRRIAVPPRLSPDGQFVFLQRAILAADDGALQTFPTLPEAVSQYFVGANGTLYTRFENVLTPWSATDDDVNIGRTLEWDWRTYAWGVPTDVGLTPAGEVWFSYMPDFEDARLVWLSANGDVKGFVRLPYRPARVLAVDGDFVTYMCGLRRGAGFQCEAFRPGQEASLWMIGLSGDGDIVGGALASGRLYVAQSGGVLTALAKK